MGDTPKPPGGQAPLPSGDPCSFLTRVPGGAGYKMLAAPRKGASCVCLGRRSALFEVRVEFLATGYLPMRSTRGSRPLLAFESVMKYGAYDILTASFSRQEKASNIRL